ncbi:unnamed protein product [Thlaspi arvense]|uniref:Histone deacetylase interacting domain-containing protein n=1 Tax=Thlaspi arvense TaxID=13288 RepID=A0AAU9RWF6_THLAR|nr:unnamed protein product [Thlaspi arvense]CAH2052872.1 unnamed protein product [Thlaspi arvense]
MTNDNEELCKIIAVGKIMAEKLSPSEMGKLISLIQDFDKHRISHGDFGKSIQLLFAQKHQEDGKTQQEVEIRQNHPRKIYDPQPEPNSLPIRVRVVSKKYGHPKIGADLQVRVKEGVTKVFSLNGKKRRILEPDTSDERSVKKTRTSKRMEQDVSPSYVLIPEEARSPVKDTVLNNTCRLKRFDNASGYHRLSKYQVAMATCEDEMFETDMLMGALRSAIDTAERVMREEMRLEDVGVKFYRCIDQLYGGRDMSDIVREDHKKALPLISGRLKQKLDELTSAKEKRKYGWQKIFQDNTARQMKLDSKRPKAK